MALSARDVFGSDEPPPPRRTLRAGPLTAVLEAGQLRDIRWQGVEVIRGIAYLLRDAAWGTLPVALANLTVQETDAGFLVRYRAQAAGHAGRLSYLVAIEGRSTGALSFEATATAESDFTTNRAGFVVLHPDDAAGGRVRAKHSDGQWEETAFPQAISPHQPIFDILALDHEPVPGMRALVEFEGGTWEMEDQRNWSDASFKTYVRPLALPFPYTIPAGETQVQAVRLTLSGGPEAASARRREAPRATGRMPTVLLRLDEREEVPAELPTRGLARGLIVRWRPGDGPDRISAASRLASREGMGLSVEAVFPQRDPDGEARECLEAISAYTVEALLVAAARDLRTRPTGLPAGETTLHSTVAAVRRYGFQGRVGAGVPSFFPEFNRNPPPAADFAFFGVCPIVHAADDASVMETLRVLPAIMESAARLVPGSGLWPGPLAIPPVVNPYGPALVDADGTRRICLAARDPRHGALFGAAHLVAALAGVLPWAEALAPLHANGPAGLTGIDGAVLPLAFVLAEVAGASGAALVRGPAGLYHASLAWETGEGRRLVLASTSDEPAELPWPQGVTDAARLAPGSRGWEPLPVVGPRLALEPYATLRLTAAGR